MRLKLAMDPEIIEKYFHTGDYPSIRQILDELYNNGNVDLALFSNKSLLSISEFIEKYVLDDLICQVILLNNTNNIDCDIIADVREEYLKNNNSINIESGYKPLIEWFCPNSNLLNDEWCLINSSNFIEDVHTTLGKLIDNNVKIVSLTGELIEPDYLEVEKLFVKLYNIAKSNPNITGVTYNDFVIDKDESGYSFSYEGR